MAAAQALCERCQVHTSYCRSESAFLQVESSLGAKEAKLREVLRGIAESSHGAVPPASVIFLFTPS